jgi:DNA-binding response OmpR family regulator
MIQKGTDVIEVPVPTSLGIVLIVEDDLELGRSLADLLEHEGFHTFHATDGRAALATLEKILPHMMLIDLFMPGMNGVELLKVVKDTPRLASIPRVIMTAANDRMVGVKEDAPVIYKPIDFAELLTLVRRYVPEAAAHRPDGPPADGPPR